MKLGRNILKILRILVILLPVALMLSSCSKDGLVEQNDNPEAEAEQMKGCWQESVIEDLYNTMAKSPWACMKRLRKAPWQRLWSVLPSGLHFVCSSSAVRLQKKMPDNCGTMFCANCLCAFFAG